MTIPFIDLFKKLAGRFGGGTAESGDMGAQTRVVKKPASERLSKTVLPNATRSFSPPDPFRSPSVGGTSPRTAPLQLGAQRVTAVPKRAQSTTLPPALARALEPKIERTISLRIADFIDAVPTGFIKSVEVLDAAARVSLKASEIEKGMPEKKPTIALPSLYQQVPEIFLRGVRADDDTRVPLPYEKVLEQFKTAHVREDQIRDPAVPQLDTPILKATVQDSERFGTKIEPIETSELPPVPVKPATAKWIAEAEPEPVIQQTTKSTSSAHPVISLYSPDLKPKSEPPSSPRSPTRTGSIPFELSPNGTGASASERVPASSGPPVPTPLPLTPELAKIAMTPPPMEEPKPTSVPELKISTEPPAATPEPPAEPAKHEQLITLSLKAALQNLPAFQLNGDPASVSNEERIALPLDLIEKQLATGRVAIAPQIFQNALPENRRSLFQIDEAKSAVVLPLEEVLKNLPETVLKLRGDQTGLVLGADFETPFSIKAKEDEKRFGADKTPVEKVSEKTPTPEVAEAKIDSLSVAAAAVVPAPDQEKLDPKKVVTQASALAGVKACAITFSDGLSLAGELPQEIAAEGLCAMAPSVLERINQHVHETKLGAVIAVTLYAKDAAVSFFARGNICLTALHTDGSLPAETRAKIADLVEKLSAHYAKSE
jgi:predicted regulator of Ras-like GTPase activity (Roadblock/LC7/MglB family)